MDVSSVTSKLGEGVLLLAVGFPLVMLLLGELIHYMERRNMLLVASIQILRNLVAPSVAIFILLERVMMLPADNVYLRLAETMSWIAVIFAALTVVNIFLFAGAAPDSWQAKVPQLFRDLARLLLVLVGSAIVLSEVWGADLGGFLTALGVGSLVIGLALQDSLGNIFSGVALLFEQPVSLGDWIEVGDIQGLVVVINWRSIHLLGIDKATIIVPNSELAKQSFKNYNRPRDRKHVVRFEIAFSYDDPPNRVIKILEETALQIEGILANPRPRASVDNYGDFSITYELLIYSDTAPGVFKALKKLRNRIWYVAKRHHLTMPYPISSVADYEPAILPRSQLNATCRAFLKSVPGLANLSSKLVDKILTDSEVQEYIEGELILEQDRVLPGLYVILEGQAKLMAKDIQGNKNSLGILCAGELFGEKASLLSDQTSDTSVWADEDLRVLLINTKVLRIVLEESPRLVQELGDVMEVRRRAVKAVQNAA